MKSLFLLCLSITAFSQDILKQKKLEPINVKIETVQYKGKDAVHVSEQLDLGLRDPKAAGETLAIIQDFEFSNGTIELEIAGAPRQGADTTARGFVGLAFRLKKKDTIQYEAFYLRPTNGRSSDQLRRNHSTQYISHPEFPWFLLRKENPGVYESYVDLVPGEWTKIKIVVKDRRARLYVHDAAQPCLVVSDIKHSTSAGQLALWIGVGTEGYFRNLRVKSE